MIIIPLDLNSDTTDVAHLLEEQYAGSITVYPSDILRGNYDNNKQENKILKLILVDIREHRHCSGALVGDSLLKILTADTIETLDIYLICNHSHENDLLIFASELLSSMKKNLLNVLTFNIYTPVDYIGTCVDIKRPTYLGDTWKITRKHSAEDIINFLHDRNNKLQCVSFTRKHENSNTAERKQP